MLTKEQIAALSAPFPIEAHTVREGFKNGQKTKIRWFVYIDVREVTKRLTDVLGSEWSTTKPDIVPLSTGIIASIGITIQGETRWYTGGQDFDVDYKTGAVNPSSDDGKGAVTDAIRRAASLWGVAEYIYDMDAEFWTDSYDKGEWDKQKALKSEALKKFTDWYNRMFKAQKPASAQTTHENGSTTPTSQPDANLGQVKAVVSSFLVNLTKQGTPVLVFGVGDKYAYAFTRKPFEEAGYDVTDWKTVGSHEMTPPAEIACSWDKKAEHLKVDSAVMVDVFEKVS